MPEVFERIDKALAGRYRIERQVGAGGMALVFLAHDVRHDRKVAFRVLRPEGRFVVYVQAFPGPSRRIPVSNNGGLEP